MRWLEFAEECLLPHGDLVTPLSPPIHRQVPEKQALVQQGLDMDGIRFDRGY
jgi:hypothetical protein